MLRISVGPCTPYVATKEVFQKTAMLARRYRNVGLHTHLCETLDEGCFSPTGNMSPPPPPKKKNKGKKKRRTGRKPESYEQFPKNKNKKIKKNQKKVQWVKDKYNMTPLEFFKSAGWHGDDVWFAHCVHLNSSMLDSLATSNSGVAHCPTSNMILGKKHKPKKKNNNNNKSLCVCVFPQNINTRTNIQLILHNSKNTLYKLLVPHKSGKTLEW